MTQPSAASPSLVVTGYGAWLAPEPGVEPWWENYSRIEPAPPALTDTTTPITILAATIDEALARAGLAARPMEGRKVVLLAATTGLPEGAQPAHFVTHHLHFVGVTEECQTDDPAPLLHRAAEHLSAGRADAVILVACNLSSTAPGAVAFVFESRPRTTAENVRPCAFIEFEAEKDRATVPRCTVNFPTKEARVINLGFADATNHRLAPLLLAVIAAERGVVPSPPVKPGRSTIPGPNARPWFGASGVRTTHVALESDSPASCRVFANRVPVIAGFARSSSVLCALSAQSPADLLRQLKTVAASPDAHFSRVRELANQPAGPIRAAIVCDTAHQLGESCRIGISTLEADPENSCSLASGFHYSGRPTTGSHQVAMMFPGQGSQYLHMNRDLLLRFPSYRNRFETWNRHQFDPAERPIAEWLYPDESSWSDAERLAAQQKLTTIEVGGQGALVASLGMYRLFESFDAKADCLVGYSNGENVTLFASGMLGDEGVLFDAMRKMHEIMRSRSGQLSPGNMLAVTIPDRSRLDEVLTRFEGRLHLALDNCPGQLVLFATRDIVAEATAQIQRQGGFVLPLPFDRPFHTPLYQDTAVKLRRMFYDQFEFRAPRIPVYSSGTVAKLPHDTARIRDCMTGLWHQPVRFRETIERMYSDGVRLFLEMGPGAKLTGYVDDILRGRPHHALSASSEHRPGLSAFLNAAATLFVHERLDPARLYQGQESFQVRSAFRETTTQHGPDDEEQDEPQAPAKTTSRVLDLHLALMHDFLASQSRLAACFAGRQVASPRRKDASRRTSRRFLDHRRDYDGGTSWNCRLDVQQHPFLRDHAFGGKISEHRPDLLPLPIVPLAYSLEIALDAAMELAGAPLDTVQFIGTRALRWITAEKGAAEFTVVAARRPTAPNETAAFQITFHRSSSEALFETEIRFSCRTTPADTPRPPEAIVPVKLTAGDYYQQCLFHGETLRAIKLVRRCASSTLEADLEPMIGSNPARLPVAYIDALGQLVAYWLIEARNLRDFAAFPVQIDRLVLHAPLRRIDTAFWTRAQLLGDNTIVESAFEIVDPNGRVYLSASGFKSRIFPLSARYVSAIRWQRTDFEFSTALPEFAGRADRIIRRIDLGDHPHLLAGGDFWIQALAHMTLGGTERKFWIDFKALKRRKQQWLLGRIAAKDAVREWARRVHGRELYTADIEIIGTASGQPTVACPELAALGELPAVSITHSEGVTLAAVRIDGRPVGIDFERSDAGRKLDLLSQAFTSDEIDRLGEMPMLAGWVAKEAAAKVTGAGLQGAPRQWRIVAATGEKWVVARDQSLYNVALVRLQSGWIGIAHLPIAGR